MKFRLLIAFLLLTTSAVAEILTVQVSRLVPEETVREVLAMVEDARVVTGLDIRVRRIGLLRRGEEPWLKMSPETMREWERARPRARAGDEDVADGGVHPPVAFSEPVTNLVSAWLQETLGVIWPAPGELARLPVEMDPVPFAEWRRGFEADPPRGYISRRFSGTGMDAAGREWRRRNRAVEHFSFSHQHFRLIRPEHFESHPQLFAKGPDGEPMRPPYARVTGFNDHPDLSEDEVVDWIADAAIGFFENNPQRMAYSIAANDSFEFGHFAEDYEFFEEGRYFRRYPDYSNHVFHFSNRVAERVGERFPDKYLGALAYLSWENVPDFPVHPKVVPYMTADRTQWYDEAFREEDLALTEAWAESGVEILGTWNYFYGQAFIFPRSIVDYAVDSIRALHQRGVRAYYSEVQLVWGFDAHRAWLMKQLLWNVDADAEELLEQFFEAYYGPAAQPMRAFFDHSEQIWKNQPGKAVWLRYYLDPHQAFLYSQQDLQTMRTYLQSATETAQNNGTPDHQRRVNWANELFELTEVFVEYVWLKNRISGGRGSPAKAGVPPSSGSEDKYRISEGRAVSPRVPRDSGSEDKYRISGGRAVSPRVPRDRREKSFSWSDNGTVGDASLPSLIEYLDTLENRFLCLRDRIAENPLNRRRADTNWALSGDPRSRVLAELADHEPIRRIRLGWDLWDSHWRKSLIDSESAHLDLVHRPAPSARPPYPGQPPSSLSSSAPQPPSPSVLATNIRRGQLFTAIAAEAGKTYQARVPITGYNGPSAQVFVRLDWYDEHHRQLSSTPIDRLPPGGHSEPFTLGPVATAPEGTAFVRIFIRFYEQEPGDELWIGEVELIELSM